MRAHHVVSALLSFFALTACTSDDELGVGPLSPAPGRETESSVAPGNAPSPGSSSAEGVAIQGRVRSGYGPDGVRPITVVDAKSRKQSVTADADGKFGFDGVVPPYDIVLTPRAPNAPAVAYLGGSKVDPVLQALDGVATPWHRHIVQVNVTVSACFTATCFIAVRSVSPNGSGSGNSTYGYGQTTATVAVPHSFPADGAETKATIHVLTSAGSYNAAQYGKVVDYPMVSNGSTSLSVAMQEMSIDANFSLQTAPAPAGWRTTLTPHIAFSDGAMFHWYVQPGGALTLLPRIPGAKLSVTYSAHDPVESTSAWEGEYRYVQSTVEAPFSNDTTIVPVAVPTSEPLELTSPRAEGTLAATADVEWSGPGGCAHVAVANHATNRNFTVVTSEKKISRARLQALGIAIDPGTSVIDLRTAVGKSVDDSVVGVFSPVAAHNASQLIRFTAQ